MSLTFNYTHTWQSDGPDTNSHTNLCYNAIGGPASPYTVTKHWRIFWTDGYDRRDAYATGTGQCYSGYFSNTNCPPHFNSPYWYTNTSNSAKWNQTSQAGIYNSATGTCNNSNTLKDNFHTHNCPTGEEDGDGDEQTVSQGDCDDTDPSIYYGAPLEYDNTPCEWAFPLGQDRNCNDIDDAFETCSPIVIDVSGNGFELTDADGGVDFDLNRNGIRERLAWTAAGSDDAWLALVSTGAKN